MEKNELLLTEYKVKIKHVTDQFLNAFLNEVPKEKRSIETAGAFLSKHNASFRSAVAAVGTNMIHESDLNMEVFKVVTENNAGAIASLFVEIMNACIGGPALAPDMK